MSGGDFAGAAVPVILPQDSCVDQVACSTLAGSLPGPVCFTGSNLATGSHASAELDSSGREARTLIRFDESSTDLSKTASDIAAKRFMCLESELLFTRRDA